MLKYVWNKYLVTPLKVFLLFQLISIIIGSNIGGSVFAQPSPNKYLKKARRKFVMERYRQALPYYHQYTTMQANPQPIAYLETGLCYLFSSYHQDSAYYFIDKYIKNTPKPIPQVPYYLAMASFYTMQFEQADSLFRSFRTQVLANSYGEEILQNIDNYLFNIENLRKRPSTPAYYWIENMGEEVNTIYADYAPIAYSSDKLLFTSRRIKEKQNARYWYDGDFYEDIYAISLNNQQWKAYPIDQNSKSYIYIPANKRRHDATVAYNHQKNKMIIYRRNKIWYSELRNGEWTRPKKFPPAINKSIENVPSASFSVTGDTLFFTAIRKEGYGEKDIYYSVFQNNQWQPAVNIGNVINTEYDEDAPYMDKHGNLYFSSRGHSSIGGYDIFVTHKTESNQWASPEPLPVPINSIGHDIFYSLVDENKSVAIFSSNRPGGIGNMDLYTIHYQCKPADSAIFQITSSGNLPYVLASASHIPLPVQDNKIYMHANTEYYFDIEGIRKKITFDSLCFNHKYFLHIETQQESTPQQKHLRATLKATFQQLYTNEKNQILATPETRLILALSIDSTLPISADTATLASSHLFSPINEYVIFFDVDKWEPTAEELSRLQQWIQSIPRNAILSIEGHADSTGIEKKNISLSKNRAQFVAQQLLASGFKKSQLTVHWYGSRKPRTRIPSEFHLNRRTEIRITGYKK